MTLAANEVVDGRATFDGRTLDEWVPDAVDLLVAGRLQPCPMRPRPRRGNPGSAEPRDDLGVAETLMEAGSPYWIADAEQRVAGS
jgi:hypothetical protein